MDRRRGNIVVSRRAIMEETFERNEIVQNLLEGQQVEGVVKSITVMVLLLIWAASTACCTLPILLATRKYRRSVDGG